MQSRYAFANPSAPSLLPSTRMSFVVILFICASIVHTPPFSTNEPQITNYDAVTFPRNRKRSNEHYHWPITLFVQAIYDNGVQKPLKITFAHKRARALGQFAKRRPQIRPQRGCSTNSKLTPLIMARVFRLNQRETANNFRLTSLTFGRGNRRCPPSGWFANFAGWILNDLWYNDDLFLHIFRRSYEKLFFRYNITVHSDRGSFVLKCAFNICSTNQSFASIRLVLYAVNKNVEILHVRDINALSHRWNMR